MARKASIGQAEMEILRYIEEHHPVSVREVADFLAETKGHARTTALSAMERLRKKGFLERRKEGVVFQYSPTQSRPQMLQKLVSEFVHEMLGGSLHPFAAYLAEKGQIDEAERQELLEVIRQLPSDEEEEGSADEPMA